MMKTIAKYGAAVLGGVVLDETIRAIVRWSRKPAEASNTSSQARAA